jgi:hypothetical protein
VPAGFFHVCVVRASRQPDNYGGNLSSLLVSVWHTHTEQGARAWHQARICGQRDGQRQRHGRAPRRHLHQLRPRRAAA